MEDRKAIFKGVEVLFSNILGAFPDAVILTKKMGSPFFSYQIEARIVCDESPPPIGLERTTIVCVCEVVFVDPDSKKSPIIWRDASQKILTDLRNQRAELAVFGDRNRSHAPN